MYPLFLIKKLGLLHGTTALDIGAENCKLGADLASEGFTVDVVDIKQSNDELCAKPGVTFHQIRFEELIIDNQYDIVIARHVLPFVTLDIDDSITRLSMLTKDEGICLVTLFGPRDDWHTSTEIKTIDMDTARTHIQKHGQIMYESEEYFAGPTKAGEMKQWHILTFVIKKSSEIK